MTRQRQGGVGRALPSETERVLGRALSETEHTRLARYLELLLQWQKVHRLVGSADPLWIVEHIILDSLLFFGVLPPGAVDVLDIGSGAGVPGLLMKIVKPELRLVMVESRRHRASFLSTALRELGLRDASVINSRVESVAAELAGQFDGVVARCAGALEFFVVALDLVRPGGMVIASGPPRSHSLPIGEWVTVPGVRSGATRRFAIARRPEQSLGDLGGSGGPR